MRLSHRILYFTVGLIAGLVIALNSPFFIESGSANLDGSVRNSVFSSSLSTVSRESPFIFVGGWPRSGTTLMRVLLDVHSAIRCGPESRVIPQILNFRHKWGSSAIEKMRLDEAGLKEAVLDAATAAFIMEIIARNGEPAAVLCDKDPMNMQFSKHLNSMFPNARFILMIRDGRAVVNSIVKRNVTLSGVKWNKPGKSIAIWEKAVREMYNDCLDLGPTVCLIVKYENLVLQPRKWLRRILNFLNLPWEDQLLRHWEMAKVHNGVKISSVEKSSNQVVYPIHLEALSSWTTDTILSDDLKRNIHIYAPLIQELGYDVINFPPQYGEADPWVLNNTKKLESDEVFKSVFGPRKI